MGEAVVDQGTRVCAVVVVVVVERRKIHTGVGWTTNE